MALSLPDARQLSDEVLEALRLRAVRGCELGFTQGDIADLLGVSQETVSRWWTAFTADGPGALPGDRTGRPVGSGRSLADEQARHIQDQARALLAATMHIRRIGTDQARPSLRQPHLQVKHPVNVPERIRPQPAPGQRMRGRRDEHLARQRRTNMP